MLDKSSITFPWFKNTFLRPFGYSVTDEELKDIEYPLAELIGHVTQRSVQVGCVLGGLIVQPLYRLRHWNHYDRDLVRITSHRLAGRFAIGGLIVGPLMTMATISLKNVDEAGIYDRCYRLRNNNGQVFVDGLVTPLAIGGLLIRGIYGFTMASNLGLATVAGLNYYNQYFLKNPAPDAPVPGVSPQKIVTTIDETGKEVVKKVGGKSEWTNNWKDEANYKTLTTIDKEKVATVCWCKRPNPKQFAQCKCTCHRAVELN